MFPKKLIALITAVLFFSLSMNAQMPGSGRTQGAGQNMNLGHFYGKLIEASNNKPLEAASVQLIQSKFDTVVKKRKDVVIGGMLTNKKGEFSIENLPIMGSFKLKITAIGYKSIEQKVNFDLNMGAAKNGDFSSMLNGVDKDLGNIKMETDAQQLQNVTVTAKAPLLEMKIDRKVFNVEKNLTSVGGTAVDVMKNVPSVNVDIDGNVTLRNAAPQIFVDGRPTTLTLDQIPADAIASVEIITNPSAKFDASGGGAGILNIVLKKNRKAGYNGNVRASIDSRGKPGLGGDFNVKQGKVNFFASSQMGIRKSISTVSTEQTSISATKGTAHSSQNNGPVNNGFFAFGRLGMDYFIDNRNTITIGGNIVRGRFKTADVINISRDTVNIPVPVTDNGYQSSNTVFNFHNYGSTLSFKHNFAKAGKEWTADANYNYSKNDNQADIQSQYFYSANNPKTPLVVQQTLGGGVTKFATVQTDFVNPISDKKKLEMGLRSAFRDYSSFNNNIIVSPVPTPPLPSVITTKYQFNDAVYAAYTTFSQQFKKFSYQLGLRAESSNYKGELLTTGQKFSTNYPLSLFPSTFFTYKLTDKQDLQLNYSRKINRPNFFQLLPYLDNSDPLNLSKGNPALKPEFTTLIELAYQKTYGKSNTFLATVYLRNTNGLISRYQYRDTNKIAAQNGDTVLINSYVNANTSYTYGLELIGKNKINSWWDITTNLNLFHATLKAGDITKGVSNNQFSWFGKLNNNFKLPKNYSIQLSGDYQAKTILPPSSSGGGGGGRGGGFMGGGGFGQTVVGTQGYTRPNYGVDIAIKKEFLKNNAASLTLQMSDIFRTKRSASHSESDIFVQDIERRRDPQLVRLNFNWRFGKFDVSLFKRKNLKGEMENMQNSQQGMGQ